MPAFALRLGAVRNPQHLQSHVKAGKAAVHEAAHSTPVCEAAATTVAPPKAQRSRVTTDASCIAVGQLTQAHPMPDTVHKTSATRATGAPQGHSP